MEDRDAKPSLSELIDGLESHLSALAEYSEKAFEGDDSECAAKVAAELMTLMVRTRRNTPVLLQLMKELGREKRVSETMTIYEYMQTDSIAALTKEGLVRGWAEQADQPEASPMLREIADTVLSVGKGLLED